jgi:hypothetical protein
MEVVKFPENACDRLSENGFVAEEDAAVGEQVSDMKQKGFSCLSPDGLDFLLRNVLRDKRIIEILKSSFPSCGVGGYTKFWNDPGHIFLFRRGGESAPGVLVVLLWGSDSEIAYFQGSHKQDFRVLRASNGLWEVPEAALGHLPKIHIHLKSGGLTIHDARVAFEFRKEQPIACVFTTPTIYKLWSKISLPNRPEMSSKVQEINRTEFGGNFQFTE